MIMTFIMMADVGEGRSGGVMEVVIIRITYLFLFSGLASRPVVVVVVVVVMTGLTLAMAG